MINKACLTIVCGLIGNAIGTFGGVEYLQWSAANDLEKLTALQNKPHLEPWRDLIEMRLATQSDRMVVVCPSMSVECVANFYLNEAKANAKDMGYQLPAKIIGS